VHDHAVQCAGPAQIDLEHGPQVAALDAVVGPAIARSGAGGPIQEQVRAVLLIALLAVVRKLIILDLKATDALQLLALAAAILALGAAYWMVRDQDRRRTDAKEI
jgi:hypothetical protein